MALLARRTAAKDTVAADVAGSILAVAAEEDENAFDSFDSPCVPRVRRLEPSHSEALRRALPSPACVCSHTLARRRACDEPHREIPSKSAHLVPCRCANRPRRTTRDGCRARAIERLVSTTPRRRFLQTFHAANADARGHPPVSRCST